METTFENAQVGDKVWDEERQEYGLVVRVTVHIVVVNFKINESLYVSLGYSLEGVRTGANIRTLYWDKLVIPCRPKRKVKKVIEGWYNIYPDRGLYSLESRADERALPSRLGKAHFIHHEYEVEE